jgi:hypothetical protein
MSAVTPDVKQAVRELYYVFRPYVSRRHPEGCPCCVTDADKKKLFSKPLEQLTSDDLGRFAWKVLTTWGNENDLKHFLPRLLELVAEDDCVPFDREVLFGKLRLGRWTTWERTEQLALVRYFDAVWSDCITRPEGTVWLDELLCGLGRALDDLEPYLKRWENCQAISGYDHLCAFVDWNIDAIIKKQRLTNSFWSDAEGQMNQVKDWLLSAQTAISMQQIFEANLSQEFSDSLARAIDRLAGLRMSVAANR